MKRRFRFLFFLLSMISVAAAFSVSRLSVARFFSGPVDIPATALPRKVFLLEQDKWTTFRIPSNANRLTILSRAHFFCSESELLDREFPYTISYQLEKLNGDAVSEGKFDLRANYIPMVDDDGIPHPAAFFSDRRAVISTSRSSALELAPGELVIFRVRLESSDPKVSSVSIRAFQTREVDKKRPAYLWSRMNRRSLERIAERRVHSLTDISPAEQLNILRNRPVPLGAFGVAGDDFNQKTLYIRSDLAPAQRELIEPLGVGEIRCGPTRNAVIGVPPPGGMIHLEFKRVEGVDQRVGRISWFGESIHERETFEVSVDSLGGDFRRELQPGILLIESPVPVTVRPSFRSAGETERLLEMDPVLVRVWRTGPGAPVTFSRKAGKRGPGFLRISARPVEDVTGVIHYELLNEAGTALSGGRMEVETTNSLYDFEITPEAELSVTDSRDLILELSSEVAAVRIDSEEPFFLKGYSRPSGLVHRTRVPSDYARGLPNPDRLPVWFDLRPERSEELMREHRSHLLQVQVRPPVDDADILAGKYQWEDFHPVDGVGQYLFMQRDPLAPARIEALPSLYAPLSIGRSARIFPESPPGVNRPSRRLAFVRESGETQDLQVYVDGQLFFERRLVTSCGEIQLPPFPANFQSTHVRSGAKGMQCFINYIKPDSASRLKRLAQRVLKGESLEYFCEKITGEEELLTGTLFTAGEAEIESEIFVTISPGDGGTFKSVSESYTNRERTYIISPDLSGVTPVLGGPIPSVDAGRRFFIPFGRDMEPGLYRVNITCKSGPGGYLTLSKVLSGEYSEARFFRDNGR